MTNGIHGEDLRYNRNNKYGEARSTKFPNPNENTYVEVTTSLLMSRSITIENAATVQPGIVGLKTTSPPCMEGRKRESTNKPNPVNNRVLIKGKT